MNREKAGNCDIGASVSKHSELLQLTDIIWNRAADVPDGDAFILLNAAGKPERITNRRLFDYAMAYAHALKRKGAAPGEPTMLLMPHSAELFSAFWGALLTETVPFIFPYMPPNTDIEGYLNRAEKEICNTGAVNVVIGGLGDRALKNRLEEMGCRVLFDTDERLHYHYEPLAIEGPDDLPAYIQFSSGTTGRPRGAVLSRRAVLSQISDLIGALDATSSDVLVSWLPPFHDMGLVSILAAQAAGMVSVLMSPFHWLRKPCDYFRAIHQYRGTISWMPNFGFAHCVRAVREEDLAGIELSGWRILGNGAEPIRHSVLKYFSDRFGPYGFKTEAIRTGYGMAENVLAVTLSQPGSFPTTEWISRHEFSETGYAKKTIARSEDSRCMVSSGVPVASTGVGIVDENGEVLPDRMAGEIVIRGKSLFSGYYNHSVEVQPVLDNGWFRTGDLGYMADGELFVCGRKKDIIIVGGRNVFPSDIEKTVLSAGKGMIRRAAAFGIESSKVGTDMPVVVCESRRPLDVSEQRRTLVDIRESVYRTLSILLADVVVVERGWIEYTGSGKIARRRIAEKYAQTGRTPAMSPISMVGWSGEEEIQERLILFFQDVLGVNPIRKAENFFDLGVDSLLFFQIFSRIEDDLGIGLDFSELLHAPTIEQLSRMILRAENLRRPGSAPKSKFEYHNNRSFGRWRRLITDPDVSPVQKLIGLRAMITARMVRSGPFYGRFTISYEAGMKLVRRLCGSRAARRVFFQRHVGLFHRLLTEIVSPMDREEAIFRHLVNNFLNLWRVGALRRMTPAERGRWIRIEGASMLHQEMRRGKGVILVHCHFPLLQAVGSALSQLGIDASSIIGLAAYFSDKLLMETENRRNSSGHSDTRGVLISQLYVGKRVLEQGGIVHIVPDAYGEDGLPVIFFGRRRLFMPGFAELALQTGASVMPVIVRGNADGSVRISFNHPFDVMKNVDRKPGVEFLVLQYARFLAESWRTDPGNISWRQAERFFELPKIDPSNQTGGEAHFTLCRCDRSDTVSMKNGIGMGK